MTVKLWLLKFSLKFGMNFKFYQIDKNIIVFFWWFCFTDKNSTKIIDILNYWPNLSVLFTNIDESLIFFLRFILPLHFSLSDFFIQIRKNTLEKVYDFVNYPYFSGLFSLFSASLPTSSRLPIYFSHSFIENG